MKRWFIVMIAVLLLFSIVLAGCKRVTETEEQVVVGTVTERRFRASRTTYTHVNFGKSSVPLAHIHPAEYLVTITYGDISHTFNNVTLYRTCDVGDSVEVTLVRGYTADHELVQEYLQY